MKNPLPTVTAWDHNSIVAATLVQMNNHCDGRNVIDPIPTITAGNGHFGEVRAFLIKYYGQGTGQDVKEPLDTVTSRDRFGLVTINGTDYKIVDIGLRMLEPKELYGCQGFPEDYIIDHDYTGKTYPRSEQVRRCGNAVCPPIPAALVKANLSTSFKKGCSFFKCWLQYVFAFVLDKCFSLFSWRSFCTVSIWLYTKRQQPNVFWH